MRTAIFFLAVAVLLSGTAVVHADDKGKIVWMRMSTTPFEKRGELYKQLLKENLISPAKYQEEYARWEAGMPRWAEEQKEKRGRARALAALTPAQRLDLEMRQKELNFQRQWYNARLSQQAAQEKRARTVAALDALAGTMNQVSAQMREDQHRQEDFNRALILQRMRNMNPPTYDSTITPTYPGGPVYVHTERTGGY